MVTVPVQIGLDYIKPLFYQVGLVTYLKEQGCNAKGVNNKGSTVASSCKKQIQYITFNILFLVEHTVLYYGQYRNHLV